MCERFRAQSARLMITSLGSDKVCGELEKGRVSSVAGSPLRGIRGTDASEEGVGDLGREVEKGDLNLVEVLVEARDDYIVGVA